MNCQFCDRQYDPEDTNGQCPQCLADITQKTPFLGAGDDDTTDSQKAWRSGSSEAQRQNILNARATLDFLRKCPNGATKHQIRAAGITPSLMTLEQHGLARWDRAGREKRPGESAVWHAVRR